MTVVIHVKSPKVILRSIDSYVSVLSKTRKETEEGKKKVKSLLFCDPSLFLS